MEIVEFAEKLTEMHKEICSLRRKVNAYEDGIQIKLLKKCVPILSFFRPLHDVENLITEIEEVVG